MASLYLLAKIGGVNVAIASENVDSVVRVNDIIPVPKSDPIVKGLFALRSRVLTLIDSEYRVTGNSTASKKDMLAVIVNLSGFQFGLLVDAVDDVVTIEEEQFQKSLKPSEQWTNIATMLAEVDGKLVTIIDPEKLIVTPQSLAA